MIMRDEWVHASEPKVPIVGSVAKTSTIQFAFLARVMITSMTGFVGSFGRFALAAAIGLVAVGCDSGPSKATKKPSSKGPEDPDALFSDGSFDTVPADAVKTSAASGSSTAETPPKSAGWSIPGAPKTSGSKVKPTASPEPESGPTGEGVGAATQDGRRWSVMLMSFTGEEHRKLAIAACEQVRKRYPLLADAFVRSKDKGSVVVVGRFSSPKDETARPLLKDVQSIVDGGTRPFARALLTRWTSSRDAKPGPLDLRQARQADPSARRLYSMEVAVWSDFGSGEMSMDDVRKKSEAQAKQLRAQGHQAFYYHDDDRGMSIVTIGVFGEDAYNPQTMLYSDAVEAVKKKFPNLMVNGETLLRVARPGSKETTPEKSLLIEVPQ